MERYASLLERHQWLARRVIIFGLHVHIGIRDGDHAAATINGFIPYLPHLLALSASSPFWQGEDTGLASSRITMFEAIPTAGHPCTFPDWKGFESLYESLRNAGAVRSIKDLWWDIRPHPDFGTIEVRVCDVPPTLSEVAAIVALTHALCHWLDEERPRGGRVEPPPDWLIRENKWRASRWGLDTEIVLDAEGRVGALRGEIDRLLTRLQPAAKSLGCAADLEVAAARLEGGLSYERQRRVFERTRSTRDVAEALVEELRTDRPIDS
jgi:carboxylate-amine ligase